MASVHLHTYAHTLLSPSNFNGPLLADSVEITSLSFYDLNNGKGNQYLSAASLSKSPWFSGNGPLFPFHVLAGLRMERKMISGCLSLSASGVE